VNQEHQQLWRVVATADLILGNPEIAGRIPPSLNCQYREALAELYDVVNKHVLEAPKSPRADPLDIPSFTQSGSVR
jgi:hypothetical protein